MLYLIIIGGSMLLIMQLNYIYALPAFVEGGALGIVLSTVLGTISVIAWDGIQALLIRRLLPKCLFLPGRLLFSVSKSE